MTDLSNVPAAPVSDESKAEIKAEKVGRWLRLATFLLQTIASIFGKKS